MVDSQEISWDGVFYWAYRVLGPEFKGPTLEDPLGALPIPLKTALLIGIGERLGLEFDLAEATLTRPPNEGQSYRYVSYWWPSQEGVKELLNDRIAAASLTLQRTSPAETLTLDEFIRLHRLEDDEHYAEVLFLKEVFLPLFGAEALSLLTPQTRFLDEEGRERRADFVLFGQRPYALEIEGQTYHERPDRFAGEKLRQRSLSLRGIAYYPIAYQDILSGKARRALVELAKSDPVLGAYLKEEAHYGQAPRFAPPLWLVDLPARYPVAIKGAFARLLQAVRQQEGLVQILDPESSSPLVEATFADAYFTLLHTARLAGIDIPLPEVRVIRTKSDEVSPVFRTLLPLWTGGLATFSVVDDTPEADTVDIFTWERITSLASEAEAFQAQYEKRYGPKVPSFEGVGSAALSLDFFARKFFPVPELKEPQLRLISRALQGESGLALLPTGYGKSLVFQLYSFLVPGVNIVISPLRALMRDQVYNLKRIGCTAVESISSDDDSFAKKQKTEDFSKGRYRLVYIAPERIRIKGFADTLQKKLGGLPISAVTVDEAHCVSEWGHDFRPAYLHIGRFFKEVQARSTRKLPLIALTATASEPVRRDILRVLELPEDAVEQLASSDRPNLSFSVHHANGEIGDKRKFLKVLLTDRLPKILGLSREELLGNEAQASYPHAGVIFAIYADPRGKHTSAEGVHSIRDFLLKEVGLSNRQVQIYASKAPKLCPHCGSSDWYNKEKDKNVCRRCENEFSQPKIPSDWDDRMRQVQDRFQENRFPLLVATKGYGMGVDKRNIRFVVHHAISGGLEGYYQEAGRAGRDGRHAHVALIVTPPKDACLQEHVLGGASLPPCFVEHSSSYRPRSCPYGLTGICDYAHQLDLLQKNYPGLEEAVENTWQVAKSLWDALMHCRKNECYRDKANEEGKFEYALVRLMQIGFIEGYTVQHLSNERRRFWFPKPKISHRLFDERLRAYLAETKLGESEIERRLAPLRQATTGDPLLTVREALRILLERIYETVYPMRIQMLRNLVEYALSHQKDRCRRLVIRSFFDDRLPPDDYRCGFCDVCEPSLEFSVSTALISPREAEPEEVVRRLSALFQYWTAEEADLLLEAARQRGLAQAVMLRSEYHLEREGISLGALFLAGALKGQEDPAQGVYYLERGIGEALQRDLDIGEIGPFFAELGKLNPPRLARALLSYPQLRSYNSQRQVYEEVRRRLGDAAPATRLVAGLTSMKFSDELEVWTQQEEALATLKSAKERIASITGGKS
jgi:ATP-dependent DNA helicase RecQ